MKLLEVERGEGHLPQCPIAGDATMCICIGIKQQPALHRLGLFYNLHLIYMQVFETFINKKWQTVM